MLYFAVSVNDKLLYHVGIQRKFPTGRPIERDEVCVYHLVDSEDNLIREFTHRYGDGALKCIEKALHIMIENEETYNLPSEKEGT